MSDYYLSWYRGCAPGWRLAMLRLGPVYLQVRVTTHFGEWRIWAGRWR